MSMSEEEIQEARRDPAALKRMQLEDELRQSGASEFAIKAGLDASDVLSNDDRPAFGFSRTREIDALKEVYKADPANDRLKTLEKQLNSKHPPTLEVMITTEGRAIESVVLAGKEIREHVFGTLAERRSLESRKICEKRVARATAAAGKVIREHDGFIVPGILTRDETLDLNELGAIADYSSAKPFIRESWRKTAKAATKAIREGVFTDIAELPYSWANGYKNEALQYGPNAQQMFISDVWDEQAKCAFAFAHDPVAKQSVKIITDFVMGRGVTIECANKQVQSVVDEFVSRTNFMRRLRRWSISASRDGELFLHMVAKPDGRTDIVPLEPRTIWEITTLATDVNVPISYVQRYMTRNQIFAPQQSAQYISREYPAAEIIHMKLNVTDSEVRGRSDMYASLLWHKFLRDYWSYQVQKEKAQASYTHDVSVKGTNADVQAVLAAMPLDPPPGSLMGHNDKVEVKVLNPEKVASSGEGSTYEGLLGMIAMGYGFSKLYLGADGSRSRAGSTVQAEPSEKGMDERQDELGETADDVIRWVITTAADAGLLSGVSAEELYDFSVQFPAILRSDATAYIANLIIGRENNFVSDRTAAQKWANEMEIDGYDYDVERARIEAEIALGIQLPPFPGAAQSQNPPPASGEPAAPAAPEKPTVPDPTSSDGKAQIKTDDKQVATLTLEAAIALVVKNGGTVVRAH